MITPASMDGAGVAPAGVSVASGAAVKLPPLGVDSSSTVVGEGVVDPSTLSPSLPLPPLVVRVGVIAGCWVVGVSAMLAYRASGWDGSREGFFGLIGKSKQALLCLQRWS